jgi:3-oxoadipate enol-lactonase
MLARSDAGTGTPLVLLHAFPFDRRMWEPQAALENVRLLCPDLPGFGESPVADSNVDTMADALADWLDTISIDSCVLGGCSMGGYVALAFARKFPDRLRGLLLIDTKAEPDDEAGKANRQKMIDAAPTLTAANVIEGLIPKALNESTRTNRPEVVARVRRIGAAQSVAGIVSAQKMMRDRPDSRPSLAAIRVPTLVIVGEQDTITPPAGAKAMAAAIPGASYVELPDAGHLPNIETPIAFHSAVSDWLSRSVQLQAPNSGP